MPTPHARRVFTLIALPVVIALIAVLIGLLLAAGQKVREAVNRIKCTNNLKQIGIAFQASYSAHDVFPSGGWGWRWVGEPDRGMGPRQPGGWIYQILPYVEQDMLFQQGTGLTGTAKSAAHSRTMSVAVKGFNCPSRRTSLPYPYTPGPTIHNADPTSSVGKSDYAANAGDGPYADYWPAGPNTLAQGDGGGYSWTSTRETGVVFQRSYLTVHAISD